MLLYPPGILVDLLGEVPAIEVLGEFGASRDRLGVIREEERLYRCNVKFWVAVTDYKLKLGKGGEGGKEEIRDIQNIEESSLAC